MIIDCDRCAVRGDACTDCVVTVLLGAPRTVELDGAHERAIDVLAGAGMVPRLRLVPVDHPVVGPVDDAEDGPVDGPVDDADTSPRPPTGLRPDGGRRRAG